VQKKKKKRRRRKEISKNSLRKKRREDREDDRQALEREKKKKKQEILGQRDSRSAAKFCKRRWKGSKGRKRRGGQKNSRGPNKPSSNTQIYRADSRDGNVL